MLLGIMLDDLFGEGPILAASSADAAVSPARMASYLGLLTCALALAVAGVARAWPGSIGGDRPSGTFGWGDLAFSAVLSAAGVGLLVVCVAKSAQHAQGSP